VGACHTTLPGVVLRRSAMRKSLLFACVVVGYIQIQVFADEPKPIQVESLNSIYSENLIEFDQKYLKKTICAQTWTSKSYGGKLEKRGDDYLWLVGVTEVNDATIYGYECRLSEEGAKQLGSMKPADRKDWKLIGTVTRTRTVTYLADLSYPMISLDKCYFVKK
jgi:hypothetical protein